MQLPVLQGVIRRRMLVNFRVDADVMTRFLPAPFRPKLHRGYAIAGICLIRLEEIRPRGVPACIGLASENAAHRVAVEWTDRRGAEEEGVYIPRRDTGSRLNSLAGGRLFPGEHHYATFEVRDNGRSVDLRMRGQDGQTEVHVAGEVAEKLPADSCFTSLAESSDFFEGGCIGYSVTRESGRYDGLRLSTHSWSIQPLAINEVRSSFFADLARFPTGSAQFDHALIMRDIEHEWHPEEDLHAA